VFRTLGVSDPHPNPSFVTGLNPPLFCTLTLTSLDPPLFYTLTLTRLLLLALIRHCFIPWP